MTAWQWYPLRLPAAIPLRIEEPRHRGRVVSVMAWDGVDTLEVGALRGQLARRYGNGPPRLSAAELLLRLRAARDEPRPKLPPW